jgi:hypothetical protein
VIETTRHGLFPTPGALRLRRSRGETVRNPIRRIRRFAVVLAGLAGALLAATVAVAADRAWTTRREPATAAA